ncbi:MAG: ComEA family DNA-binding protein [Halioglobus sp.]|nr:ComEA family DNA-binding protein [Halioglobus sp.]
MINDKPKRDNARRSTDGRQLTRREGRRYAAFIALLFLGLAAASGGLHARQDATVASVAAVDSAAVASTDAMEPGAVNINTADARALAAGLTGIGVVRAEEIVRYRETYGPFSTVEELAEVTGIGKSTLDNNRSRITLE